MFLNTIDCPKCDHEHEPSGSHEDDSGTWECEECGFSFECSIEYDPSYSTECVKHEYSGELKTEVNRRGEEIAYFACVLCGSVDIQTIDGKSYK